jgi:hypothetical protein
MRLLRIKPNSPANKGNPPTESWRDFKTRLAWQRLRTLRRWAPTRHLTATAAIALGILRSPRALTRIFGLSFFIHLLTVVLAWCTAHSVGAGLSLAYALFLGAAGNPDCHRADLSCRLGSSRRHHVAAFGYAGLPPSDGLIISLLFGASYLVVGGIGGLVWVLTTRQVGGSEFAGTLPRE